MAKATLKQIDFQLEQLWGLISNFSMELGDVVAARGREKHEEKRQLWFKIVQTLDPLHEPYRSSGPGLELVD